MHGWRAGGTLQMNNMKHDSVMFGSVAALFELF
jgi:hypothetical protein